MLGACVRKWCSCRKTLPFFCIETQPASASKALIALLWLLVKPRVALQVPGCQSMLDCNHCKPLLTIGCAVSSGWGLGSTTLLIACIISRASLRVASVLGLCAQRKEWCGMRGKRNAEGGVQKQEARLARARAPLRRAFPASSFVVFGKSGVVRYGGDLPQLYMHIWLQQKPFWPVLMQSKLRGVPFRMACSGGWDGRQASCRTQARELPLLTCKALKNLPFAP